MEIEAFKVGVLNIYAPTDLQQRASFWQTLAGLVPEVDSWIVGGDFNNLEMLEDHQDTGPEFIGIAHAK